MIVPRPRPLKQPANVAKVVAPKVAHKKAVTSPVVNHVTDNPGQQSVHQTPEFKAADGKGNWTCMASGFGRRSARNGTTSIESGALRHIGAVDMLGKDLPALHPRRPDCIVSVRRKKN